MPTSRALMCRHMQAAWLLLTPECPCARLDCAEPIQNPLPSKQLTIQLWYDMISVELIIKQPCSSRQLKLHQNSRPKASEGQHGALGVAQGAAGEPSHCLLFCSFCPGHAPQRRKKQDRPWQNAGVQLCEACTALRCSRASCNASTCCMLPAQA